MWPISTLCQSTKYSEPSGANSISTGRKLESVEVIKSNRCLLVYPEDSGSSTTICCLVPKNPIVLLINRSPCTCLLYTSDAADDLLCVDLCGRRIIKKKKKT